MNIDIIILSYAKTVELKQITLNCLKSLAASENPDEILFNTLVIESNKEMQPYQYPGTKTIYPEVAFGYNKYMNIGINATNNFFLCLCNNDLIFHQGWATEILKAFGQFPILSSANPYSEGMHYDARLKDMDNVIRNDENLHINGILTGWCIFVKRSVFQKIGQLDERFTFWYADNDYNLTLRKFGLKHALVKSSLVTHLFCQSHDLLMDKKEELTTGQKIVFDKKWHPQSPVKSGIKKIIKLLGLKK